MLCFAHSAFLSLCLDGQRGRIGFTAQAEAVLTLTQRRLHSSGSGPMTERGLAWPGPAWPVGLGSLSSLLLCTHGQWLPVMFPLSKRACRAAVVAMWEECERAGLTSISASSLLWFVVGEMCSMGKYCQRIVKFYPLLQTDFTQVA